MRLIADVSNNNAAVSIGAIARVCDGLMHKASQAAHFVDALALERATYAAHVGLPFGVYHFAGWTDADGVAHFGSPTEEATNFLRALHRLPRTPRDLLPALDLEVGDPAKTAAWAREWNSVVFRELGVWPMFYSYSDYAARMRLTHPVGNGLWLASYSRNDGRDHPFQVPAPWRKARLHQFTSVGAISGVATRVDLSHGVRLPLWHPVRARLHGVNP